jgi:hypothetical protein
VGMQILLHEIEYGRHNRYMGCHCSRKLMHPYFRIWAGIQ